MMATENKTYNGYTNYETWAVALWLDNEQGSCEYWAERAEEVYRDSEASEYSTRAEEAESTLADEIQEQHEEANPVPNGTVFSDLMSAALSEVNWREIASHYIADLDTAAIDAEDAIDEEDEESDTPDEDDITTSDGLTFYQSGKVWLVLDKPEDAAIEIPRKMLLESFFPNVWMISDHGNPIPYDYRDFS